MTRDDDPRTTVRSATEDARREARAAAAEVRHELDAARAETSQALRDAMQEMRAAFTDVLRRGAREQAVTSASRLSRAERKEMTRELLLDAAIEVFARKGYHGASLDDVAEAAGFTKGAVYSNFSRKSDLFQALLERETRRRNQALGSGVASVPLDALPALAGEWLGRQAEEQRDWDILTIEFWLTAVRDPALRETMCRGQQRAMDHFATIIDRKLEEAGRRAGLSGRDVAVIVNALGSGLLMEKYLDPDSDVAAVFARAVAKLLADSGPPATDAPDEGSP